ncbi:hypothetical protein C8B47_30855, partial [filamentous cyanobacterium CCP4]
MDFALWTEYSDRSTGRSYGAVGSTGGPKAEWAGYEGLGQLVTVRRVLLPMAIAVVCAEVLGIVVQSNGRPVQRNSRP